MNPLHIRDFYYDMETIFITIGNHIVVYQTIHLLLCIVVWNMHGHICGEINHMCGISYFCISCLSISINFNPLINFLIVMRFNLENMYSFFININHTYFTNRRLFFQMYSEKFFFMYLYLKYMNVFFSLV